MFSRGRCLDEVELAIQNGDVTKVKQLLDTGQIKVDVEDMNGITPLGAAAAANQVDVAKILLEYRECVNAGNRQPLQLAAEKGHSEMVHLLLDKGADASAENVFGQTALHHAGSAEVIDLLVSKGCNVNHKDSKGETALHFGLQKYYTNGRNRLPVVKSLLNAGCSANIKDHDGQTPLHTAVIEARGEDVEIWGNIVSNLIGKGADVSIKDNLGKTPVDYAPADLALLLQKENDTSKRTQPKHTYDETFKESRPNVLMRVPHEELEFDVNKQLAKISRRPSSGLLFKSESSTEYAIFLKSLTKAMSSVGIVYWSNGLQGTLFRVGSRYAFTCYHVIRPDEVSEFPTNQHHQNASFDMDRPINEHQAPTWCQFAQDPVKWVNEDLDVALLELNVTSNSGTHDVDPITRFDAANPEKHRKLHFIGHPDGKPKIVDMSCNIHHLDFNGDEFQEMFQRLTSFSMEMYGDNEYVGLNDVTRLLYQASEDMSGGSSGCPGFVVGPRHEACVAVIHAKGFPTNHRRENIEHSVEQGIRIEKIRDKLREDNPDLCRDVFDC